MALTKIKLNEVDTKADPVLADGVLLSDSADGGRGKISTLTDLQTLIGGGGGGGGGAVDSVAGKTGVVTLDASDISETAALKIMTADERTKLTGIAEGAEVNTVDSVAGKTGDVTLDADDVSPTASKLWMSDTQASKLSGIAEGANNYTHPETHPQSMIVGLADALAAKATLASPALTGTPTAPTAASGTDTTQIATTAFVQDAIADISIDADPYAVQLTGDQSISGIKTFTSSPVLPTPTAGDDTTKAATTAFVQAAVAGVGGAVDSVAGKTGDVTLDADDVAPTASKLWMSDTQASKLSGIAENANNYTHPATHPQSMIVGLATALAGKAPLADPEFTGVMQSGPQLTKLAGINQWILRNPSGAAFSGGSNSTGIVKIMLPNIGAGISFIVSVEIEVFDYISGGSYSAVVDGFFAGVWTYGDARAVFGSIPNAKPNILVGFGVDNGRAVIALENTTTTRTYIRVRVPRVMISWVTDPTPFLGDWSVSVLTASDSTVFAFTRTCYRPLNAASPALTGTPTAPTAASGTDTTQIATTAFVQAAVAGALSLKGAPGGPTGKLLAEGTSSGITATEMNTTQLTTDALTGDLLLTEGTPSGPTANGTKGMARFDADYFYVCTATNTWVRFPKDGSWT